MHEISMHAQAIVRICTILSSCFMQVDCDEGKQRCQVLLCPTIGDSAGSFLHSLASHWISTTYGESTVGRGSVDNVWRENVNHGSMGNDCGVKTLGCGSMGNDCGVKTLGCGSMGNDCDVKTVGFGSMANDCDVKTVGFGSVGNDWCENSGL
ncbi:hypothetical protein AVEN_137080-1 [Araneus ventricosus]|uniref:SRCR domain-containing protein n=1 Tax=Araneus ventricosus TaxID=182803 RepID=A0A4Y2TQJ4_ARAVE|nr:hypothetical protein AVEN_137080-1 [Araneus ventricosus]